MTTSPRKDSDMVAKTRVGIIGTGNIAPAYVSGCRRFEHLDLIACADLDHERALGFARTYDLRALTIEELLADRSIDIVINLTVPQAHAQVSLAIIKAGKHVYSEKPLATTRQEARKILRAADKKGVRVGCAPDTFLGGGIQTCRKLIDEDWIGEPIAATGFMGYRGPDLWHPNPSIFFQRGAGPMLDMGPYYLTALVTLMGGIISVAGMARASYPTRCAGHEGIRGQTIPVEVPTHVTGVVQFESGALATLTTTFDIWAHGQPIIEIYGTEGSLRVPDPNAFDGVIEVYQAETRAWREVPLMFDGTVGRGIGVADLARAVTEQRPHRASGTLAYHILDAMLAFVESAEKGRRIALKSSVDAPAPLGEGELAARPLE